MIFQAVYHTTLFAPSAVRHTTLNMTTSTSFQEHKRGAYCRSEDTPLVPNLSTLPVADLGRVIRYLQNCNEYNAECRLWYKSNRRPRP